MRSIYRGLSLGSILVGALLLGPAVWASGEEVSKKDAARKTETKKGTQTEATSDETRTDASTEKKAKTGEGVVHPTFNTVEEIRAYRGSTAELWTCRVEPDPVVTWRTIDRAPPSR